MAFDPDKYLQARAAAKKSGGGFDPDAYLAKRRGMANAAPASAQSVDGDDPTQSKVTAAAAGALNPLGLLDEMSAAGSTGLNAITGISGPLAGGSMQDLVDEYRSKRDSMRGELSKIQEANPKTYVAGRISGGLATGGLTGVPQSALAAGGQSAALGAANGLGESDADLTRGEYEQATKDTLKGAGVGLIGGVAGYGIGKGVSSALNGNLSKGLNGLAEKYAVKATGATGKQIENFDETAGRELLDRGLVKFGDTPGKIADRAEQELSNANSQIGGSLNRLDEQGAGLSNKDILAKLDAKIAELSKDPAQGAVVRQIKNIRADIEAAPESVTLSAAENTKRGFQNQSNYMDQDATLAKKAAADVYRQSVEDSATQMNPDLAGTFKEGKKTYGLIAPIQEAAQRRANTLQQSPVGGLLDVSSAGAGFLKGGPLGALVAPVARRVISPRIASSLAVSADGLADILSNTPEALGEYAPVLQNAAARGGKALAATNDFLIQSDPQYAQRLNQVASKSGNDSGLSVPPTKIEPWQTAYNGLDQNASPVKGEDLWAKKGLQKLEINDDRVMKQLLNSKKGKSLLIEASDLPAGSKRLLAIKNKLSNGEIN
jgi:hypothetical protein